MSARARTIDQSLTHMDTYKQNRGTKKAHLVPEMNGRTSWGDFENSDSYFRSLKKSFISGYSFIPRSIKEEDRDRVEGGGRNFKRTLTSFQLVCLGIGTHSSVRLLCIAIISPGFSSALKSSSHQVNSNWIGNRVSCPGSNLKTPSH